MSLLFSLPFPLFDWRTIQHSSSNIRLFRIPVWGTKALRFGRTATPSANRPADLLNEDSLTAAENVLSVCLFIFVFIVGLGAHTACSPVPGILPRMRKQFLDPELRPTLREAGIDGWVAFLLLVASVQNHDHGEYFFHYYMETLAARPLPIVTFEDFRTTVDGCMWVPAMEPHLLKAWDEVKVEWARVRGEMETNPSVLDQPLGSRPWDMYGSHLSIPMSSPYSTAHMRNIFVGS